MVTLTLVQSCPCQTCHRYSHVLDLYMLYLSCDVNCNWNKILVAYEMSQHKATTTCTCRFIVVDYPRLQKHSFAYENNLFHCTSENMEKDISKE